LVPNEKKLGRLGDLIAVTAALGTSIIVPYMNYHFVPCPHHTLGRLEGDRLQIIQSFFVPASGIMISGST